MTDDLVKWLRETSWGDNVADTLTRWDNARYEAADRIEALTAENERLREALAFYADEANYKYLRHAGCSQIEAEGGDTARAALGEKQ